MTFQTERFSSIKAEMEPLTRAHWDEMPFDLEIPLAPDMAVYDALDAQDKLHILTARDGGRLVGYFANFIGRHPHYDILISSMDVYFLLPEYRKAANGLALFVAMEEALIERGVRFSLATARLDRAHNASKLFERLGWTAARTVYSKKLGV